MLRGFNDGTLVGTQRHKIFIERDQVARAAVLGPGILDCPTFPDIEIPDSRADDQGLRWPKNFPVKSNLIRSLIWNSGFFMQKGLRLSFSTSIY